VSDRHVLVVGSGPSGVHFAQTALSKGYGVTMVDVGRQAAPPVLPDARFDELKEQLDDPAAFFLGGAFEGVLLPDEEKEYYGIPPGRQYVFEDPAHFAQASEGFEPLFSFARGGLAEVWTAGCYPFNDVELGEFPFSYDRIAPHYDEVARRIGITGATDDLSRFYPVHQHLLAPLPLDRHSESLLRAYERHRGFLNGQLGAYVGRTRVAALTQTVNGRQPCMRLGRCLWGCPRGALYTPSQTVQALLSNSRFEYRSGLEVLFFDTVDGGRATTLTARSTTGEIVTLPIAQLALAAGTLSTTAIMLRSARRAGASPRVTGLMDNRQVLVPFVTLNMLGRRPEPGTYQYHLLGMGLEEADRRAYVHGQITTLKTALLHPIIQQLPFDMRTSLRIARVTHAALGVVNVNFHDTRRDQNWIGLEPGADERPARICIHYEPEAGETARMNSALKRIRRVLRRLGCVVPPGMTHVRPMGASVHYAGVFPMTASADGPWTTDVTCRSRAFPNVLLVDGSTFPFLPAKNLTFTLMANASRAAAEAL
jgi:choline dehydrogenase-like flavoprotein